MKIAIIDGGAIGLLFSYYLSQKHQISLYTRSNQQAELITETGVGLVAGNKTNYRPILAKPVSSWDGTEDITFITVKEYQLSALMPLVHQQQKGKGALFFLQNGMGHLKFLDDCNAEMIYLGAVEHGAVRINENSVAHNGQGITKSAIYKGNDELLKQLMAEAPAVFPFTIESDYYEMLAKKLLVNAVINPLTATFHVTNGTLLTNPYMKKIAHQLFYEAINVLQIDDQQAQLQNVWAVCEKTASNTSSMLKDIEAGRATEIDAILGYLLAQAERKHIEVPIIHNYYLLIKGLEYQKGGR